MAEADRIANERWQFGDYDVLEEVGRGGMGAVYQAHQRSLDRIVALKMFHGAPGVAARSLVRFKQEAQTAAQVQHPNIVRIYDAGQIHGQAYFAMELIDGKDLDQATATGPLASEQAARYLSRIAHAVACLHSKGILHRDLKPSNILIDEHDEPKVTDFGIARASKAAANHTDPNEVLGSPCYMAPEQANPGAGPVGPWTDVYGMGALLFRLLTGKAPFEGNTDLDTMLHAIRSAPPRPGRLNPRVPPMLEAICLKCLEKNPERRYASADSLAADLDRYLADEPVVAADSSVGTWLRRWALRETNVVVHVVTLAVVALAKVLSLGSSEWLSPDMLVPTTLVAWISGCLMLRSIQPRIHARAVGMAWGAMDIAFLTAALMLSAGLASAGVVGYTVIIVASALWLRITPIVFSTIASFVAVAVLTIDSLAWHPARRLPVDGYVIVAVTLCAASLLVLRHVRRTRALSRLAGARRA